MFLPIRIERPLGSPIISPSYTTKTACLSILVRHFFLFCNIGIYVVSSGASAGQTHWMEAAEQYVLAPVEPKYI
jgi:hypothetical protein